MQISPPFLSARTNPQADAAWLDIAMNGGSQVGDGFFPISALGGWHGGLHLRAPTAAGGSGLAPVCAIGDGTVAYRRSPEPRSAGHSLNYHGDSSNLQWTDNGVVILRHTFELGPGALTSVIVYSIYQHLSKLHSGLPTVGKDIKRNAQVGEAGSFAGKSGVIHFEIIVSPDQIGSLCGRNTRLLNTEKTGRSSVFGEVYARLPVGTLWKRTVSFSATSILSASGVAGSETEHTSTEVLYIGLKYENAACIITTYKESGEVVATYTEALGNYALHSLSAKRFLASAAAGYELMRYGRVLASHAESLANTPHWREIAYSQSGVAWVNLNAADTLWYSDSDFPHWRGWQLVDDDVDGDVRCDSAILNLLRYGEASSTAISPTLGSEVPTGNLDSIKNLICLFPSEWDEGDDVIETRYGWIKKLPVSLDAPTDNFEKFRSYIKALGFWQIANLTDIPSTHWHLNPRSLIGILRGGCLWPDLAELWRNACTDHTLPVDVALSEAAKINLYDFALRSSQAAVTNHTGAATTAPLVLLDAGGAVIFGMRVETDIDANLGKGLWDDRVTVLKKDSTGLPSLIYKGSFTTEPSGRYLAGGRYFASPHGSNVDVGGTSDFDAGRLVAQRSYEYQPGLSPEKGPLIPGTNFNILKKSQASLIERLVTTVDKLPPHTYVSGGNANWITGTTANFSELQTMHFHKGYNGMTGSAGCQTFPVSAGATFIDFANSLKPLLTTTRFQYVLKSM